MTITFAGGGANDSLLRNLLLAAYLRMVYSIINNKMGKSDQNRANFTEPAQQQPFLPFPDRITDGRQ